MKDIEKDIYRLDVNINNMKTKKAKKGCKEKALSGCEANKQFDMTLI